MPVIVIPVPIIIRSGNQFPIPISTTHFFLLRSGRNAYRSERGVKHQTLSTFIFQFFTFHFQFSTLPCLPLPALNKIKLEAAQKFILHGQTLWLSALKCIYWEEQAVLIITDTHFGKTGHFRKEGIAVPQTVYREDLQRLFSLIQFYKPEKLIVVGDMFHAAANKEMELFMRWRNDHPSLKIDLVMGNHDILQTGWYVQANISITHGHYILAPFCFIHDIADKCETEANIKYFFCGHLHPSISIKGMGRQSLHFPCFYFTAEYAILPAFGKFTGTAKIKPAKTDQVFAILPPKNGEMGSVMKL